MYNDLLGQGTYWHCGIRLLERRGLRESDTETASDDFILIPPLGR
jgi:hypothetical protein